MKWVNKREKELLKTYIILNYILWFWNDLKWFKYDKIYFWNMFFICDSKNSFADMVWNKTFKYFLWATYQKSKILNEMNRKMLKAKNVLKWTILNWHAKCQNDKWEEKTKTNYINKTTTTTKITKLGSYFKLFKVKKYIDLISIEFFIF
jgi:hypothetical protein